MIRRILITLFLATAAFLGAHTTLAFAAPLAPGTQFSEPIGHSEGGVNNTVTCQFQVIAGNTVMVVGDQTMRGARAVDLATAGSLNIPQTVSHLGENYTVTRIGDYAFGGDSATNSCAQLTAVTLPATIQQIGTRAFAFNGALTNINLPGVLGSIDTYAFYDCPKLTQLDIPSSVTSIRSYAFSRCSGLKKVIFRGNAPTTGSYVFTGSGVQIEKVIYYGKKLTNQAALFNSQLVAQPEFFYTVHFYLNQAAVTAGTPLSTAIVSGNTDFLDVRAGLDAAAIYEGSIPAFPGTTNFWLFQGNPSLNNKLADSCYAYALLSNYNNLSLGRLTVGDQIFTGRAVDHGAIVSDMLGTTLTEGKHFTYRYYRQDPAQANQWVQTSDTASPGTVRVTATGTGTIYNGSLSGTFTISFSNKTFEYDIPLTKRNGTLDTAPCSFRITSMSGMTGTVAVARSDYPPAGSTAVTRAIPTSTDGALTIPDVLYIGEGVNQFQFTVTQIDSTAFQNCALLNGVTIPQFTVSIGASAFSMCYGIETLVFAGNASAITFGDNVFTYDSLIQKVIYYGRKEAVLNLFYVTARPTRYYTITFFDREAHVGQAAGRLGSITISERTIIANIPGITTMGQGVYSGSTPAYPSWVIDDSKLNPPTWWYAPTWVYPEVNADNQTALRSTLTDSVSAYAAQTNDVFTIDDAIIVGLTHNEEFAYNGFPVVRADEIAVCGIAGGRLTRDVHYTQSFERETSPGVWAATSDVTSIGNLRMVLKGINHFSATQYVPFSIINKPGALGSEVYVDVVNILLDGTETTTPCLFRITSVADGKLEMAVASTITTNAGAVQRTVPALPTRVEGKVIIPSTVRYNNINYTVTTVSPYAFGSINNAYACRFLVELVLPSSLRDIGTYAFANMRDLTSITVPSGLTSASTYAFALNANLTSVILGGGITTLAPNSFQGCTALQSISLPVALTSIENNAFNGCTALRSVQLPAGLSNFPGAFINCTALEQVTLPLGMSTISERAFQGCSALTVIDLPSTLTSIGAHAFDGTSLRRVDVSPNITNLGNNAFANCASLTTVVFEGDASFMTTNAPFFNSRAITTVAFMSKTVYGFEIMFPTSASIYVTVTFYASEQDLAEGNPLGRATILRSTMYRTIRSDRLSSSLLFGESTQVPALPTGTTLWRFEGNPALNTGLTDSLYAYAVDADLKDLAYGKAVTLAGYRYTGSDVNPFTSTSGRVVDADGNQLMPELYTITFQRSDGAGGWVTTSNIVDVGAIRVLATATGVDGYSGTAIGQFAITAHLVGDTFTHNDMFANPIIYYVTSIADNLTPGTVQVGRGGASDQAVVAETSGAVVIPELAKDENNFEYVPTTIASYAFYRRMGITSVVIPSKVTRIGANAFAYVRQNGDIAVSNLDTIVFNNNMARTVFGQDIFLDCNVIKTIIYSSKKGTYTTFGSSQGITRYYTARFYESENDFLAGTTVATLILKEGAAVDSPSPTDLFAGTAWHPASDTLPSLASNARWRFEPGTLGIGRAVNDSLYVFARTVEDNTIEADVSVRLGTQTTQVSCTFDVLLDEDDQPTNQVQVGVGVDGQTAIDPATLGIVTIPASIADGGETYEVARIANFAFGASEVGDAALITGVEFSSSMTTIGRAAFMNCSNLSSVAFAQDGVAQYIEPYAFANTLALQSISLPVTLQSIGDAAFLQSGLTAVRIPQAVTSLGKRAFLDNAQLAEVVFDGVMSLDLQPLGGLPLTVTGTPEQLSPPSAFTRLSIIDDYVFANCTALRRIVFDADVSRLTVSPVAFEGATGLEAIVYGDRRNTIDFPNATPQVYLTASYFSSLDAQTALDRSNYGYLCVKLGSILDTMGDSDIYAGSKPAAPGEYEWRYNRTTTAPLNESAYVYLRKVGYELNATGVDGAFGLTFKVGDEVRDVASNGEYVQVQLAALGAVTPTRLVATSDSDGSLLVDTTERTASFEMPNGPVTFQVEGVLSLEVYQQSLTGQPRAKGSFTLAQVQGMLSTEQRGYSGWNSIAERHIITTNGYLPLQTLLAACEVSFASGDSLIFKRSDNSIEAITYDALYQEERFYYPHIASGDSSGSVLVEPVLALRSVAQQVLPSDPPDSFVVGTTSMRTAWQLLYGQTPEEFVGRYDTQTGFSSQIVSITVINGSTNIAVSEFTGVEAIYYYTGAAIRPTPQLVDEEGNTLVENKDYTLSYTGDAEQGIAKVTAKGIGYYTGELVMPYRILRVQAFSGQSRDHTAALIALEAYPQGSEGVIIAGNAGFADALSASGLGGALDYPLILTGGDGLSVYAANALQSLARGREGFEVILVGGESALSKRVESDAQALLGSNGFVTRIAGPDRYSTSREIYFHGLVVAQWSSTMIVATGLNFADALAMSPYAAYAPAPIFLCNGAVLSPDMVEDIQLGDFERAIIVGGTSAVGDSVKAQLEQIIGVGKVERLGGADRYDTAARIARWEINSAGMNTNGAAVTTGQNFPDALAGGVLLGQSGAVLLLADEANTTTLTILQEHGDTTHLVRFLGGTSAVTQNLRESTVDLLGWNRQVLQ